jgi:hypothetical protein
MNGRMNGSPGNSAPFGPRAMVALVCVGFIAFVALLAAMGTREPRADNGGAHGLGKGISGYAALAAMLSAEGRTVDFTRMPGSAEANALLIVTPLAWADGKDIAQVVNRHRLTGPVLVVTPKWQAVPLTSDPRVTPSRWNPFGAPKPPRGWSTVVGAEPPEWKGSSTGSRSGSNSRAALLHMAGAARTDSRPARFPMTMWCSPDKARTMDITASRRSSLAPTGACWRAISPMAAPIRLSTAWPGSPRRPARTTTCIRSSSCSNPIFSITWGLPIARPVFSPTG